MPPIMIIAPHAKIAAVAQKVARSYHDVQVTLGLLEQSLNIAREAEAMGVEVLISRGGTAQMLEKWNVAIPVVDMPVSPYDLLNAIHRAKQYGRNIKVIGFDRIIQGVERLAPILDVNITVHNIEAKPDAKVLIDRSLKQGEKIDVLLGGAAAENLAKELGIPTVLLETNRITIENSIKEARRIIELRNLERQKAEQVRAILQYINQGVIAVDRRGMVTVFNPAAGRITGLNPPDIIGRSIDQILPDNSISKIMDEQTPELGRVEKMCSGMALTNCVPIVVKGQAVGAVETFEDVTIIQEYEQKIRLNLMKKGHVAKYELTDIIGDSPVIRKTKKLAQCYAAVDSTVLIVGESGTGKEMFAQGIHNLSDRSNGPFVAINCATIPEPLLESELFGYEEGAFTGARKKGKTGLFTRAHKGTIFLDEIAEMPIALQARLLRVIQEKEVNPLGSESVIPVDIRIIAATNKDLHEEVTNKRFRNDLFFRLNILNLKIPPLVDRGKDIRKVAEHFIRIYSRRLNKRLHLSPEALSILEDYTWPGNIRELENIIERLCVISENNVPERDVQAIIDELSGHMPAPSSSLEDMSREHILKVLGACNGNRTLAARKLNISRTSLWRRLKSA